MNIGFFDSGLGGLLILKAVAKALPQYDYVYYADTANLPYGDKTEGEIYEFTKSALKELFDRECLLVIVACNTASAETLRTLQDTYIREEYPDRKVLGVIVPTIETLAVLGHSEPLLIATKRTVASGKYERELAKLNTTIALHSVATPELVPLIESHQMETAIDTASKVIGSEAGERGVVVLGCTHYVLLKDSLREQFPSLTFISQDEVIPGKLSDYLSRHPEITSRLSSAGKREIVLSEHRPDYDRLTADFLGGVYIEDEPL
jgi:glutamate racemase